MFVNREARSEAETARAEVDWISNTKDLPLVPELLVPDFCLFSVSYLDTGRLADLRAPSFLPSPILS